MRKNSKKNKSKKSSAKNTVNKELELFNIQQYVDDELIYERMHVSDSTKDWIRNRRYELQSEANVYENKLFAFMKENNITCCHQMPFVINKNIYFADFYLPKFRCIVEVDGVSHRGREGHDGDRDEDFKDAGVRTVRIKNSEITPEKLKFRFEAEGFFRERLHNTPVFPRNRKRFSTNSGPKKQKSCAESASMTFTLTSKVLKGKKLIANSIILDIVSKLSELNDGTKVMVSTDNMTVFRLCISRKLKNDEWPSVRLYKELVAEKKLSVVIDYTGSLPSDTRSRDFVERMLDYARSFTYDCKLEV